MDNTHLIRVDLKDGTYIHVPLAKLSKYLEENSDNIKSYRRVLYPVVIEVPDE